MSQSNGWPPPPPGPGGAPPGAAQGWDQPAQQPGWHAQPGGPQQPQQWPQQPAQQGWQQQPPAQQGWQQQQPGQQQGWQQQPGQQQGWQQQPPAQQGWQQPPAQQGWQQQPGQQQGWQQQPAQQGWQQPGQQGWQQQPPAQEGWQAQPSAQQSWQQAPAGRGEDDDEDADDDDDDDAPDSSPPAAPALAPEAAGPLDAATRALQQEAHAAGLGDAVLSRGPAAEGKRNFLVGVGLSLALAPVFPVMSALDLRPSGFERNPEHFLYVAIAAAALLGASAVFCAVRLGMVLSTRLVVHERGLVVRGLFGKKLVRFDDVASVRSHVYRVVGGNADGLYGTVRLTMRDGRRVSFNQDVSGLPSARDHVDHLVTSALLPSALMTLKSGGSVKIGAVSLGPDGVTARGKLTPWTEVSHASDMMGDVWIAAKNDRKVFEAPRKKLENASLLVELVTRMARH